MHHLSSIDDERLLGDPQAEMHVLLGEQDGGAARSQFPQYLGDGGDDDRGQPFARLVEQQDQGIAHQRARDHQQLLFAACDDPEAYIGRLKDGSTLKIQANGQQFVPPGDTAAAAQWAAAFREILERGYIRDAGCHGRLFQISTAGFAYLKTHGKSPIGYIAELGSV